MLAQAARRAVPAEATRERPACAEAALRAATGASYVAGNHAGNQTLQGTAKPYRALTNVHTLCGYDPLVPALPAPDWWCSDGREGS